MDPARQAPDRCPRCGGGFQCGMAGEGPCACTTVALDTATLAALQARYAGCLCLACLHSLASSASQPSLDGQQGAARPR